MTQTAFSMKVAAKKLGTGPVILFRQLREAKILHTKIGMKNLPRHEYIERGFFKIKTIEIQKGPVSHQAMKTLVTPTGLIFIEETISAEMEQTEQVVRDQRQGLQRQQSTEPRRTQLHRLDTG